MVGDVGGACAGGGGWKGRTEWARERVRERERLEV